MDKIELERRTREFAIAVIKALPHIRPREVRYEIGRQIVSSAGSVGANYREANRAESVADFAHKLSVVEKEASESEYWLEVIEESDCLPPAIVKPLRQEAGELLRIFSSANVTLRKRLACEAKGPKPRSGRRAQE